MRGKNSRAIISPAAHRSGSVDQQAQAPYQLVVEKDLAAHVAVICAAKLYIDAEIGRPGSDGLGGKQQTQAQSQHISHSKHLR